MLVPCSMRSPPSFQEEVTETPGAKISVVGLLLVKDAGKPTSLLAPTETTLVRHAGKPISFGRPLLPADATTTTPEARNAFTIFAPAIA